MGALGEAWFGLVIAIGLGLYLVVTLVRPEKF